MPETKTTIDPIVQHEQDTAALHDAYHGVELTLPGGQVLHCSPPTIGDFTHYRALLARWADGDYRAFGELVAWLVERLGDGLKAVPIEDLLPVANAFFASRRSPTSTAPPMTPPATRETKTMREHVTVPASSTTSSSSRTRTAPSPGPGTPGSSSPKGSSGSAASMPAGSSAP